MARSKQLRRCAAFLAAGLVVLWAGGSFLSAVFKLVYWLWLGSWPDTQLYGIVPEAWTPGAAVLARGDMPVGIWNFFLHCDVVVLLLTVPPLLLLPCLLLLRADHGGIIPALRSTTKPFAVDRPASPRPAPYPTRPAGLACSMKNGV